MAWQSAILPILKHPATHQLLIMAGSGLYNTINPNRARDIQLEVLNDMQENRRRLHRMSRGEFTGAEREQVRAAAEPGLNSLAGNLAQRGLGTSPAGGQLMADAAVAPYASARENADRALVSADSALMDALSGFPADNSFFEDLGATVQAYHTYRGIRGLGEQDVDVDDDPLVGDTLKWLFNLGQQYKAFMAQQGAGSEGTPSR